MMWNDSTRYYNLILINMDSVIYSYQQLKNTESQFSESESISFSEMKEKQLSLDAQQSSDESFCLQ